MTDPAWDIHGYAIVCEGGCIADATGVLPDALKNDADWAYFQAELDRAVLCILGRVSHEATPNAKGRLRAVMTRDPAATLDQRDARTWFWNPEAVPLDAMLARLAPEGGRVAVPGGMAPFTLLAPRFDGFHLSAKAGVRLAGGIPCFDGQGAGGPDAALRRAGMVPGPVQQIDPDDGVTLTVWTRPAEGPRA